VHSLSYAALECRLTIEMICYERLIVSYNYLSYDDLKKWQPKDVVKQVIEDISALADKELTLCVAQIPSDKKPPETIEEYQRLEYHRVGTQAALNIKPLGKLWNALSNSALHVSLPKSKYEKISIYGQHDSIRKNIEQTLVELEKIKDKNLLMGGSTDLTYSFNCLSCGTLIKRNIALLKDIQIVNCVLPSCNESYILERNGNEFLYGRRKFDLPCVKCGEINEIPENYLQHLKAGQTLTVICKKCEEKMEIVLRPSLVTRRTHKENV